MDQDSTIDTTEAEPGAQTGSAKAKTAIVVVHGMGEQRPMNTLWGLVEALWIHDPEAGAKEQVYPKPDRAAGSFELRRITTVKSRLPGRKRVDFFEFYWAHLMQDNKVAGVLAAMYVLLNKPLRQVPSRLLAVRTFASLALVLIGLVYLAGLLQLPRLLDQLDGVDGLEAPRAVGLALALLATGLIVWGLRAAASVWLGPVAGDAARYLSPDPGNVAARQAIREAAVNLLEQLHARPEYDRIIVVGHSLGTVVAYDALTFAWGRIDGEEFQRAHQGSPAAMDALTALELAASALTAPGRVSGRLRSQYRTAQRRYAAELAKCPRKDGSGLWKVTDFVSTAAPLSKADVLMAADEEGWEKRRQLRDVPTCPPQFEDDGRFSYPAKAPIRTPHHAAVFGPTVWTNVYFETRRIIMGDVIAGPVRELFGVGVLDVRLRPSEVKIRHLHYWKHPELSPPPRWIIALRRAVNLRGENDGALWGPDAEAPEIVVDIPGPDPKPAPISRR